MNVTQYLNSKGFNSFEGNIEDVPQQINDLINLINLINKSNSQNVMEIGFNAGHSAEIFLKNNPNLTLTSFDLGVHDYVLAAKEYIDRTYPNRHKLVLGDSRKTVPNYFANNKDIKFDLIFIDGGHEYELSTADMKNCFHMAHKDTIVVLDDTIFTQNLCALHNIGPTRTWTEHLQQKSIIELNRKEYQAGRGMCWGKYIL